MFKRLGDTLRAKFSRQNDLSRQLEIVKVFDVYKEEVGEILPPAEKAVPQTLKNKILTIKTTSSVMAAELRVKEGKILAKINSTVGREVVSQIRYRF